ncbi:serine hydrolase domain-containing protein [Rhodococcus tukisamuensis]|uniref:CubicO group peptidase, beta-lactamase class C family n=1 Tax=Rhodococcus tukisamuensis TaxID=168276 RepID=A0A1G7C9I7_9NOCA|nr:serine hydrolase domain-containing protein [Rhodococcus tukisamuensis]SDE35075.1 CubicO group peptidase, beta-lactamase class C family [Rhodococcus tukisamuensis]
MADLWRRNRPPALSTAVTGDAELVSRVRPLIEDGVRDRVSVVEIDTGLDRGAHFGSSHDASFEIGSITKVMTAMLFADAIDRGEVAEGTRLDELIPVRGSGVAAVTLGDLAGHRSGLPRLSSRTRDALGAAIAVAARCDPYLADLHGLLAQARATTPGPPGRMAYSNLGGALLGQALAAAAGVGYPGVLTERLLVPLGMIDTYLPVTRDGIRPGALTGYDRRGRPTGPWTMNAAAPAGGVRSTPADMARFARAVLDGAAPGMSALEPRWDADGDGRIGYCWLTNRVGERTVTWHNGATGGFASMLALDRDRQRAVLVLSNTAAPVDGAAVALLQGTISPR